MYTSLGIFNLFVISIGAGASLIIDLFFITSLKYHRLTKYEFKALRRLSSIAFFGGILGGLTEITLLSYRLKTGQFHQEYSSLMIILLCAIVIIASLTIKKIHIQNLERHQHNHNHLSDHFVEHSKGLPQTASISLITWATIICIKAYELYGANMIGGIRVDRSYWVIVYLLAIIIGPYLATHFKRLHK